MVSGKLAVALACAAAPIAGAFAPSIGSISYGTPPGMSRGFSCNGPTALPPSRGGALGLVAANDGVGQGEVSRRKLLGAAVAGAIGLPLAAGADIGREVETAEMGADVLDRKEFRQASTSCPRYKSCPLQFSLSLPHM